MESVHVRVYGKVQAVGYRYFTLQCARKYQIQGWVKNLPDGSVEVLAIGDMVQLEQFLLNLKQGPKYAQVTEVTYENLGQHTVNTEKFTEFQIIH